MRPIQNGNKTRRYRKGVRPELMFSLTNKEIMADLMYPAGDGYRNEKGAR